uniref:Uncharacterized protein n=1 Tax=Arundo donax TaxID=35708 RepID=A0A0A9ASF8_ARUDO
MVGCRSPSMQAGHGDTSVWEVLVPQKQGQEWARITNCSCRNKTEEEQPDRDNCIRRD